MIEKLERVAAMNLNDYAEAYRKISPETGAAACAAGMGTAAFTGDGSPLTTVKGAGPSLSPSGLDSAEAFFRAHGMADIVIEAAPWLDMDSLDLLNRRGYDRAPGENVVVWKGPGNLPPPTLSVREIGPDDWTQVMLAAYEFPNEPQWLALARAAAHLPGSINMAVQDKPGNRIACAQMVPYDDVWILGCDGTLPDARGRGAQTALIRERLRCLPKDTIAVAEVAAGSASERNYLRAGFRVLYSRTNFRRKLPPI